MMYMYINILLMLYQTFLFFVGQQDHERNLRNQFVHKLSHVVYLQNIEQIYSQFYFNEWNYMGKGKRFVPCE